MIVKWYVCLAVLRPSGDTTEVYDMKEWYSIFPRLENRKKHIHAADMVKAGYPFVDVENIVPWKKLHELCKEQYVDGQGKTTYLWFGNRFFFTTKEDAALFRGLLYLL